MIEPINVAKKLESFDEFWSARIIGEVNDSQVKLVKLMGEFVWHQHEEEDELFLVVKGQLRILLRDGEINLAPGELAIIPHGVEHCPVADEEVHVMLIEPKGTVNTGKTESGRKVDAQWI